MVFIALNSTYYITNNNGGCCVSDNVMHEYCVITTSMDNDFELSQCKGRCSSDRFCKGFSMYSVSYNFSTTFNEDGCILYTMSNASIFCTHNLNETLKSKLKSEKNLTSAIGSLNPNAICDTPQDTSGQVLETNYHEGCYINRKYVKGNKYFLDQPIQTWVVNL